MKNRVTFKQPKRKLGWLPDRPDFRDLWYDPKVHQGKERKLKATPPTGIIDLRKNLPLIYAQGDLGSCTAQAIAAALEYNRAQQGQDPISPSTLFIYYNERVREGTVTSDAGAFIRTGIKSVSREGYAHEDLWPYNISKFKKRPPTAVYKDALKYKSVDYYRLDNKDLSLLKTCLEQEECFVFGATLYSSFFQGDTNKGMVPMPSTSENDEGGHCMLCCGYDDTQEVFIVRNSWGADIGDAGYYYIPYAYLTNDNICDDFWCIKTVN